MDKKIFSHLNKNYLFKELKETEVLDDPFAQFSSWFNDAINNVTEANAMSLATCSSDCKPSVRIVLLKQFDEKGFVFYTNYESRKGKDLKENPNASLLFFWKKLSRQIRIEGSVELIPKKESEEYFHTRPFDSQIAALASKQSSVVPARADLETKFGELKKIYEGSIVPLPEYWGGYRLLPDKMEFWQGRQNRMHDRIQYVKNNNIWEIQRLAP